MLSFYLSCLRMLLARAVCLLLLVGVCRCQNYVLDTSSGLGRVFDGIGGLSGGGATSKLLVNYAEPYRSEILDYLFKPGFGASLQILKVEIGGDAQSTDGTESSHMHESWDENYLRGYEWWLMVEAKKRNPGIKLYGLPWAFPGWLAGGKDTPYGYPNRTAEYIAKWVLAAKKLYNLDMDYIGIWNERAYNIKYVETLRWTLDSHGLKHVRLVVADGGWGVANDTLKDATFNKVVDYIGVHYPGTLTTKAALETKKPLWSSEDYSTFNDDVGAGCWARILNQNYVNGYMTSTISWNLIASYYQDLPFGRDGLMTALEPWSGHYVVESPIWITAHTTHFTEIGWQYLKHTEGVDKLQKGGSFVTLVSPGGTDVTMVIETMSHNNSKCIRPKLPEYVVTSQTAIFNLTGGLRTVRKLFAWVSRLKFDGSPDQLFQPAGEVDVVRGVFRLKLGVDEIYTLTTVNRKPPKVYKTPPPSAPFPLPYKDDFEGYPEFSEAFNFAPQMGVWEVRQSTHKGHGKVNRQVILNSPCYWCGSKGRPNPINIGGNHNWSDIFVQLDVMIPSVNGTDGVFVGARVVHGGCGGVTTKGIFFVVFPGNNTYIVTKDIEMRHMLKSGIVKEKLRMDWWFHLSLIVRGPMAYGFVGIDEVFQIPLPAKPQRGFVGYGATDYGIADYDNLQIQGSEWMYLRNRIL